MLISCTPYIVTKYLRRSIHESRAYGFGTDPLITDLKQNILLVCVRSPGISSFQRFTFCRTRVALLNGRVPFTNAHTPTQWHCRIARLTGALEKEMYSNYTLEMYSGCYTLQVCSYYTLEGLATMLACSLYISSV